MPKKWIAGALHPRKEGTFTSYAKKHGGMRKAISTGMKSANPKTQARAKFAKAMQSVAAKHRRAGKRH